MDEKQYHQELNRHIDKILNSTALKKLIVAGPGTGKTSFFKRIINHYGGTKENYLTLTFINNLEDELQRDLGDLSKVYTFHGYCHYLLRKYSNLKGDLQNNFEYYPAIIKLIKSDWEIMNKSDSPEFIYLMRKNTIDKSTIFFLERSNYYNAIGYDDSVFRVEKSFFDGKELFDKYKLVIVDEYQDFNSLENSVLENISNYSPILIVGDDDQALYCKLRDSDPEFIRKLFYDKNYEKFELPFCLRCPNAVILVFNNIIKSSIKHGLFGKRIKKRFDFFPPVKEKDSQTYPKVKLVISSIQKKLPVAANYLGKYILQEIKKIPKDEINESYEKNFPTVLIIGPTYYLNSIVPVFEVEKYPFQINKERIELKVNLNDALAILKKDERSNLGWRISIEVTKPNLYFEVIKQTTDKNKNLFDLLEKSYKDEILKQAREFMPLENTLEDDQELDQNLPIVKFVTFEGAKGLSAQHVFILGIQNGNLPRNFLNIEDIEVCKFLVALTRTRKQCHLLCTNNFAGKITSISEFIKWIPNENVDLIKLNRDYWKN